MRVDLEVLGNKSTKSAFGPFATCWMALVVLFLGSAPWIWGAQARETSNPSEMRNTVRDANGRPVEVKLPVKRIVVLTSDALEVIRAIKGEDLVKGVNSGISKDPLFWPELKNRPSVGSWRNPNYELIAQLKPDMVIGYARNPGPAMEKILGSLGIRVVRLDFFKMNSLEREIQTLGRILGKEPEAEALLKWYREQEAVLRKRLSNVENPPSVYVESYSKYHTTGPGSGGNEMCFLAGGANVAKDFSIPYPEVTPEWVVSMNPQYIIKAAAFTNAYGGADAKRLQTIVREITGRPAWSGIRAVRKGGVHVIESSIWTGPRAVIGILYMAKWFHPESFEDIYPEKIHREYLERFQGIPYGGVYTAPAADAPDKR